jgi:hypothetical protein
MVTICIGETFGPSPGSVNLGASVQKEISPYGIPRLRDDALTPEVVDPRLEDVEALARWLDYAFELPGGFRFGIGGFIGLIPGIGDVINALISSYIIFRAIQLGIPRVAVARMFVNVGIEALAGSVPVIGDLFDMAFKANRRNYQLLKSRISQPERHRNSDWLFLAVTVVLAVACVSLPVMLLIYLIKRL